MDSWIRFGDHPQYLSTMTLKLTALKSCWAPSVHVSREVCFMNPSTISRADQRKPKPKHIEDASRAMADRLYKRKDNDIILLPYNPGAMAMYASESGANTRVKLCPRQSGGTECGYYVMKFMKEIAYEGVEILDNDNVGKGVEEYSAADMDGIREDWSTYVVNSLFKL
ncbi:uncharacterized protein LOC110922633 [Helianthus annuus]|uniref:uncharacterized protein LOC110922633 n=1 Tax=Helianthus annuus TaxID=4232 RepID=UPI000B9045C8|nr:uncharacterized protein LOC110922633 [Helianthus annuus]